MPDPTHSSTRRGGAEFPRLQLLLTRSLCPSDPLELLRRALGGGVDLVQVREKDVSTQERVAFTRAVLEICRPAGVPVLVNDDVEAARRAGAAGVHLGQEDGELEDARRVLGPAALLGRSTHGAAELRALEGGPATHAGLGCCHSTATKDVPRVLSSEDVRAALAVAPVPVFAIGGIDAEVLARLGQLGVRRAAVSSSVLRAHDPESAARALRRVLEML